jgi:hypothetical protein
VTQDDGGFSRAGGAAEGGRNAMAVVVFEDKSLIHAAAL